MDEELAELQGARDALDREAEVGDLLFAAVNYARWIGVDSEAALRGSNRRFRRRFSHMEVAASGAERSLREMTAEELDALWEQAKHKEDRA